MAEHLRWWASVFSGRYPWLNLPPVEVWGSRWEPGTDIVYFTPAIWTAPAYSVVPPNRVELRWGERLIHSTALKTEYWDEPMLRPKSSIDIYLTLRVNGAVQPLPGIEVTPGKPPTGSEVDMKLFQRKTPQTGPDPITIRMDRMNQMQEWFPIGAQFEYLNTTCIVTRYSLGADPADPAAVVPAMVFAYRNNQGDLGTYAIGYRAVRALAVQLGRIPC